MQTLVVVYFVKHPSVIIPNELAVSTEFGVYYIYDIYNKVQNINKVVDYYRKIFPNSFKLENVMTKWFNTSILENSPEIINVAIDFGNIPRRKQFNDKKHKPKQPKRELSTHERLHKELSGNKQIKKREISKYNLKLKEKLDKEMDDMNDVLNNYYGDHTQPINDILSDVNKVRNKRIQKNERNSSRNEN